ncbi:hypothetical protein JCGZ_00651 [Jatropha curcas]|uniref:Uncharacterized protein n=2 Tax=Jatropha curcas TaxID=180498 RepID=A0A067JQP7_JATCU|nr:hypothetical protein JCGZ_00651 [Jatropha curcas]
MALGLGSSRSLKFQYLLNPKICTVSIEAPKGLGIGSHSLSSRSIVAFAASHEESRNSEIEVEKESNDSEESQEAWKKALDNFKEQALKMQSLSQEAYKVYSKKALVVLEETLVQLESQSDKMAKELTVEAKNFLTVAAETSPEPVKDVVSTFASSTDDIKQFSDVRDFYIGIPYGLLLQVGGFLSFMLTGSISAIRFGFVLGGFLLGLSLLSLQSYRRGEPSPITLKGQTAIAAVLFLRELRLLSQRASFFTFVATVISGAAVAFYLYRVVLNAKESREPDFGPGAEN